MIKGQTPPPIINVPTNSTNTTKSTNNTNSSNTTVHSPHFYVSSTYSTENCGFIHQNPMGYCGESNIDDCSKCNWKGCSLIQCGNQVKKEFVRYK